MIFISGVHGVGKTYFCEKLKAVVGIECYSASQLIEQRKQIVFSTDKKIVDIGSNQNYLLEAVAELNEKNSFFVLDGHFCLLDREGTITRIPEQTFIDLQPEAVVLLTEKPEIIVERRMKRDGIRGDIEAIRRFQEEEMIYAKEMSDKIGIPLCISKGSEDIESTINFIKNRR